MDNNTLFVDVILPLPVPNLYTYRVQRELEDAIQQGVRVIVQFGKSKMYTALVRNVHNTAPKAYMAKYIDAVLDEYPIVNEKQFKLWEWISDYYMCCVGEVMNAALPGSLKLASETRILLYEEFDRNYDELSDKELLIVEALEVQNILSLKDVSEILEIKTVQPIIKSLIEKRAVVVEEEIKRRYKPKMVDFVKLNAEIDTEENLKDLFNQLSRAPKQLETLMSYIHFRNQGEIDEVGVKRQLLQEKAGVTSAVVNQLVKKEVFEIYKKQEGRLVGSGNSIIEPKAFSEDQQKAYNEVHERFQEKDVVLLHGVTSSGKTEIYVRMIKEMIEQGKQVLYLLPEIALTTQIINRLRQYFGDQVGVYHSKFNENERVEIWQRAMSKDDDQYKVILGARSALFLPFDNLGLIIIDEEHENTFKQFDPAPRYHARDSAIVLAAIHKAKTLMGSATPGIESYWNANNGKYGLVELTKRYGGVKLPEVQCADVKDETRKKKMKSHFSSLLMTYMEEALEKKEQIILFQNRRGYAPLWQCEDCGFTPQCTRCDVSLTYHKHSHHLSCHYCGYSKRPPKTCDACGSAKLKMIGFGTEKIEDELAILMPKVRVRRMDLDTTRSKNAYQNIINEFENKQIDVLVGTQMVTKGLDFDNVSLVGIMNADTMLNYPDFRSFERAYQLMAQVSGRAGRKSKRGKVLIQTYNPNHWVIQQVIKNDYEALYRQEIIERRNFNYPPFFRLIKLTLRHREREVVDAGAEQLAQNLKAIFKNRVLGPEYPAIARIKNSYNKNIVVKFEREASATKVKKAIKELLIDFNQSDNYKSLRVVVDVDPV